MANTPMRPPGRPRSERRKPEGPRPVAQRPTAKDLTTKKQVQEASATLRTADRPELADAVDYLLTPAGWAMLGRLRAAEGTTDTAGNMTVQVLKTDRDRIKAAADKAGNSLTDDVNEGFAAFASGAFSPQRPARAVYGSGQEKVNLNVRPDTVLRARVEQAALDRADELGWTPRPMHVAAAWLNAKYPAPKTSRARK